MYSAELSIRTPDGKMQAMTLTQERYELGRAESADICRDVPGLSRRHLAIRREGENWVVQDLGSTNGTFVNGTRIAGPRVLAGGDRVTAGDLIMTFSRGAAAQPAPAAQTVMFVEKPSAPLITANLDTILSEETETSEGGHTRALIRAGRELAGHMPLDKLFELILSLSVEAVGASRGALMTLEEGELRIRASKGTNIRISSHVRDLVVREKRSLLVRDALMDEDLGARLSIVQDQIRSMLAIPLQTRDRVIGLIYLDSPFLVREFTKGDLSLLTVMGNIAAVRIEHARLAELEQAERLRAQEMQHAAMIQRSILPGNFPPFPDRREFQLHAAMTPAKGVGGDLFDFFLLDHDHLAFTVGDVSGKGVPAALFMAVARTLLRGTAQHKASPAECMAYLNKALAEQNESGMFLTMFYAVLNTRTGEIEFSNAGHNPPYIFSPGGTVRPLKSASSTMLGLFSQMPYTQATEQLAAGESILVYTDGVTEAQDPAGKFFEDERLISYLQAHATEPVEQLVNGLHAQLKIFAADAPQADDITALALRYLG